MQKTEPASNLLFEAARLLHREKVWLFCTVLCSGVRGGSTVVLKRYVAREFEG